MEIAVIIGAIVVSFLVFTWLLKVVRATLKTAILVAGILLALQIIFGIGPSNVWDQISQWLPSFQPTN
ncbi:MAG: hypothetical protein O3C67_03310 [Cyanobacteria bacterium]|nr:hypothetical protein [Cyanobacteriota bacterium]